MAFNLHFVLIPLICPGHVIPMVDMAKLFAQRGVTVTIVTTPANAMKFSSVINRSILSGLSIRMLQLQFPSMATGLPEGCESMDTLPSPDLMERFLFATDLLQLPLEQNLEDLKQRPSCILSDKHLPWTADVAKKFQIPWIIFDGMSCFTQLCSHILYTSKIHESVMDSKPFGVPGLPDYIEFTRAQLPTLFNPKTQVTAMAKRIRATESRADGVVINSFEELEQSYVDEYRKVKGDKLWCIGPLSLCNKDKLDKAERGNRPSISEQKCLSWLDSWQHDSVIYACLGTLTCLSTPQLAELALGLEASKYPFIWVLKAGSKSEEIEKWMIEEGFEKRTNKRSLIIRGWAPQVLILSHPAIACFLTHCGWNSTLEGVCAGVPMITWPIFAEQFFNEKLVVQVLGTGVSVGSQIVLHFEDQEKSGARVKRGDVQKAINSVMDDGKEGQERRKKARELKEIAKKSLEEGGSSHRNMTLLIDYFIQRANNGLLS